MIIYRCIRVAANGIISFFFFFFFFSQLHLQYMEVPRLEAESEPAAKAYITAMEMHLYIIILSEVSQR